jgi:hypothetical protein
MPFSCPLVQLCLFGPAAIIHFTGLSGASSPEQTLDSILHAKLLLYAFILFPVSP